jgi:hypothetical protein
LKDALVTACLPKYEIRDLDAMLVPLGPGGGKVRHLWIPELPAMKKA